MMRFTIVIRKGGFVGMDDSKDLNTVEGFRSLKKQLFEVFARMQDQFKTTAEQQPISFVNAQAFTNQGCDDALALVVQLEDKLREKIRKYEEGGSPPSILSVFIKRRLLED